MRLNMATSTSIFLLRASSTRLSSRVILHHHPQADPSSALKSRSKTRLTILAWRTLRTHVSHPAPSFMLIPRSK